MLRVKRIAMKMEALQTTLIQMAVVLGPMKVVIIGIVVGDRMETSIITGVVVVGLPERRVVSRHYLEPETLAEGGCQTACSPSQAAASLVAASAGAAWMARIC
jgi:hypothetical protein